MLRPLAVLLLLSAAAPAQTFEAAEIHVNQSGDPTSAIDLLPGRVQIRNASMRAILAAAYQVPADRITGGPAWLDSDRFDIRAKAAGATSEDALARTLQALLAGRFQASVRRDRKSEPIYALTVAPGGPKLTPAAHPGNPECPRGEGPSTQLHRACKSYSMAELLPQIARNYIDADLVDETKLTGAYDFQLDWMGKGPYDAAAANDPLRASMFDAVEKLGLKIEKRARSFEVVAVDSIQRTPSGTNTAVLPDPPDKIDEYIAAEMKRQGIPGLALGIYRRGEIVKAKGYGLANIELNVAVTPKTIFQSGSVGKQFTATAVMMLVEEGKINLDDSIVKYFDKAPDIWKPVKVKNLLSHTSGIAEYETPERMRRGGPFDLHLDLTEQQMYDRIAQLPMDFQPGERWHYTNTNYALLGIMIHRVTGKFYGDFLAERIFHPLGMNITRIISDHDIIPDRSAGYEMEGSRLRNQDWVAPGFNSTADGTLYFNVLNLAKWDGALYTEKLLKKSSLDRMWTVFPLNTGKPNPSGYGFAWSMSSVNGHRLIEHGGAWQGFAAHIARYVDDGVTVVVLANLDAGHARAGEIAHGVAGLFDANLAPPKSKERTEAKIDLKLFETYSGRYAFAPEAVLTITIDGARLFAQLTGQGKAQIFPESEREFFYKVVDAQITFEVDGQGRATALVLHQNGADNRAARMQ
jgi:uncharacterized protein (TIGR03435 family)